MRRCGPLLLIALLAAPGAAAAQHPALARARALYNAADYDGAITAASAARTDADSADEAALVVARAHLERFRYRTSDPEDLAAARDALATVRIAALSPRDQLDLLVGMGQALFLANTFGAAAEVFDTALSRSSMLPYRDRSLLLDWWATALERASQALAPEPRAAFLQRAITRMEDELRQEPGHAAANYWLAVATRSAGQPDRAWNAAVAAWVRAPLRPETKAPLRDDVDRFVTSVLIPERARARGAKDQQAAIAELQSQWDLVKEQWK